MVIILKLLSFLTESLFYETKRPRLARPLVTLLWLKQGRRMGLPASPTNQRADQEVHNKEAKLSAQIHFNACMDRVNSE